MNTVKFYGVNIKVNESFEFLIKFKIMNFFLIFEIFNRLLYKINSGPYCHKENFKKDFKSNFFELIYAVFHFEKEINTRFTKLKL
jgi:hypothetical protein